ncbi:MAG TPA: hypothetical protein VM890_09130 [Longimicrobium sp.]|jgi:hypothetical protein|nr:hypothetical protein [Longimicrobium sp.]
MSDETPRDRLRETPAPDGPPGPREPRRYETNAPRLERARATDSGPMWKGILAALGLAGAFVMAEAGALVTVLAAVEGQGSATALFDVALLVAGLALVAAVFISRRLPRASRTAFWAMGTVCIGFVMTVLIGICGMQFARATG